MTAGKYQKARLPERKVCWRRAFFCAFPDSLLYNNRMASPVISLSPEKLVQYRQAAVSRLDARASRIKPRTTQAWQLARRAARLLRAQFHATRVVVFGSLVHEKRFHEWSDIDLAAWGISSKDTFRAIGAVMDLDPGFEVNLVDVNACQPSLLAAIEREGKDL